MKREETAALQWIDEDILEAKRQQSGQDRQTLLNHLAEVTP
jgi:hypothetical protein